MNGVGHPAAGMPHLGVGVACHRGKAKDLKPGALIETTHIFFTKSCRNPPRKVKVDTATP